MGEANFYYFTCLNSLLVPILCGWRSLYLDALACSILNRTMARGQQKIQSQQKNAERQKKLAKANGPDQKQAAQAKLTFKCSVCMSQMPDPKTYKQHFESKHPKADLPDELKNV